MQYGYTAQKASEFLQEHILGWTNIHSGNPFADLFHTRMLVRKIGTMRFGGELLLEHLPPDVADYRYPLDPYNDDVTYDACMVLRKLFEPDTSFQKQHYYTMKGWLQK
jgi:hypothetical protein